MESNNNVCLKHCLVILGFVFLFAYVQAEKEALVDEAVALLNSEAAVDSKNPVPVTLSPCLITLPFFGKRKQVTFPVKEQNVSVCHLR